MTNVWRASADLARSGARGALATVARVRGSTPVPAGTKMLVGAEGRLIGTVGGLPSNGFGLLSHAAEHAARHAGQAVTTAKIVHGMGYTRRA